MVKTTCEKSEVGSRLRAYRKALGMSSKDFCTHLKKTTGVFISRQTLSSWESGTRGNIDMIITVIFVNDVFCKRAGIATSGIIDLPNFN
jgi:DNA-binding XRE family transcriptional regulator